MDISLKRGPLKAQKTACLVVGIFAGKNLGAAAAELDKATGGVVSRLVKRGDVSGKAGETLLIPDVKGVEADRVLLAGCGRQGGVAPTEFMKTCAAVATALNSAKVRNVVSALLEVDIDGRDTAWALEQQALAVDRTAYRFTEHKTKPAAPAVSRFGVMTPADGDADLRAALKRVRALLRGLRLTRDLANRPGNVCTPTHLSETAIALAEKHGALTVQVIEEAEMEALGMGAFLSVSRGSRQPAKLIVLEYRGTGDTPPIALVGKGVTFDSGGISLKPGAGMDEMKFDMGGAASVLGTMAALAEIAPPVNVVGLIAATENLPDGNASKPGDIVTSMSGQTIEILNTDAEGRLILCDTLTYAARFEPAVVIDVATLTGACIVALGEHASGLLANDDELAAALLESGEYTGDRAWRLPLWEDYQRQLDSPFADMANVGGRSAGTVTAACFLARFTRKYRWAHLDVAGTAWNSGKNKGATGRPVPLLLDYVLRGAA